MFYALCKRFGQPDLYLPTAILLGVLLLVVFTRNAFYLDLLFMIFVFAGLSGAWNIIGGYAGQISLGHAAFYGAGAYTTAVLFVKFGLPPVLGIWVSMGVAALLAMIIGYPCLRLKGPFFTLATLAVAEVLQLLAVYLRSLTMGSEGLSIPYQPAWTNLIFQSKNSYALLSFLYMLLVLGVSLVLERTRLGFHLTALREEDQAAESLGVNTSRAKIKALLMSAVLTSAGAVLVSQYVLFLEPHSDFSVNLSVQFALMPMVGGLGTAAGPLIGAAVLVPLGNFLRSWVGGGIQGLHYVIYGALLILVVMFMPHGIKNLIERHYRALLAWLPALGGPADGFPAAVIQGRRSTAQRRPTAAPAAEIAPASAPLLEVDGLGKDFVGLRVLSAISFRVNEGEIVGIIGPNGAGKTTLFNILCGIHAPSTGSVRFGGKIITRGSKVHQLCRRGMGRTYQLVKPFGGMSVLDNVIVGAYCHEKRYSQAREIALEVLEQVAMTHKKDQPAGALTLAYMKRLEVARALATRPRLLLLDEVMAGLNSTEIEEVIQLVRRIRDSGVTVLVVEHVMRAIMSLSERILVIAQGEKIMEGRPREVIADARVIKAYLGEGFELA